MRSRVRSIVVVAYGGADLLARALDGLDDECVVVVDNSSDSAVRATAESAGAHYLDPGANLGFAGGVNRGLTWLIDGGRDGDVLLLNPDARIDVDAITQVQRTFSTPGNERVAAVTPRLVGTDGVEQRPLWPYPSPSAVWREALRLPDKRPQDGFAVGAVLMLRAEALAEVGHFDERYFLYAEETDWQRRAAQLGWRSAVADVPAEHVGAATSTDEGRRARLFHAGQETYIRRWFGPAGWQIYRAGALVGALIRACTGGRDTRRSARSRAGLYLRGPRRSAGLTRALSALRVTHLVITGNRAGTERYVAQVAALQSAQGLDVTVIGGDETFLRAQLPGSARWLPGTGIVEAARSVVRAGRADIVHAHLTAADLVAVALKPVHRGRIVSTRHIAKSRGSTRAARLVSAVLQRSIAQELSISRFVADAVGRPSTVLPNGVEDRDERAPGGAGVIVLAQRLEQEKDTAVAVEAWVRSGLGERGWRLLVCGEGAERAALTGRAESLHVSGIEFRGWVADLHSELLTADALLATAPGEPLGLTVLEAMSVALPVIAAAGGGHLETVGAVAGALLFTPGDARACAAALTAFADETAAVRAAYGERLQQRQRADFSVAGHVLALGQAYERCCDIHTVTSAESKGDR